MSGLSEAERRTLTGVIQRALRDGETGLDDGACNRAGWHISENLIPAVERILAARVASAAAENAALRARLDEVRALHAPDSSGDWCDHCWTGPDAHGNGPGPAWPCATIRALDPVLAAARDEGSEQR